MPVSSARDLPRRAEAAPASAAWQHEQRNSTAIRQIAGVSESRIAPLTGFDSGKSPSLPTALPAIAALRGWLIGAGKMAETEFPTYHLR